MFNTWKSLLDSGVPVYWHFRRGNTEQKFFLHQERRSLVRRCFYIFDNCSDILCYCQPQPTMKTFDCIQWSSPSICWLNKQRHYSPLYSTILTLPSNALLHACSQNKVVNPSPPPPPMEQYCLTNKEWYYEGRNLVGNNFLPFTITLTPAKYKITNYT